MKRSRKYFEYYFYEFGDAIVNLEGGRSMFNGFDFLLDLLHRRNQMLYPV